MKTSRIVTLLLALALILAVAAVPVQAAELPEGIIKVFNVAVEGNTRNQDWKDLETGIITLPQGSEFDNGGTNHGVYHMYTPVEPDDEFYVYWVLKVEENDDLDSEVVLEQTPSWLQSYGPNAGDNEVELSVSIDSAFLYDDSYDDYNLYYDDATPGKWQIFAGGFQVVNDDCAFVQHRLHYKNVTGVQVKYLIVTSQPMQFAVNTETGEIDGITNDNEFIVPTPEPTPEPTPTPEATPTPVATPTPTKAPTTSAPANNNTTAPTATEGGENAPQEGAPIGLIIGIVAAVVVVAAVVIVVVVKKKKK